MYYMANKSQSRMGREEGRNMDRKINEKAINAAVIVLSARERFTGWDWPQEIEGHVIDGEDGIGRGLPAAVRRAARAYARDVRRSARRCRRLGMIAAERLLSGDHAGALELVAEAEREERQWGDAPAWAPVRRHLECLAD